MCLSEPFARGLTKQRKCPLHVGSSTPQLGGSMLDYKKGEKHSRLSSKPCLSSASFPAEIQGNEETQMPAAAAMDPFASMYSDRDGLQSLRL